MDAGFPPFSSVSPVAVSVLLICRQCAHAHRIQLQTGMAESGDMLRHTRLSTDWHFIVEDTHTVHIIVNKTLQVIKPRERQMMGLRRDLMTFTYSTWGRINPDSSSCDTVVLNYKVPLFLHIDLVILVIMWILTTIRYQMLALYSCLGSNSIIHYIISLNPHTNNSATLLCEPSSERGWRITHEWNLTHHFV